MKHITVKFVSTDEEKFKEYVGKLINALGKDGEISDGVYVEMVSRGDISKQIDDINEATMRCESSEICIEKINDILSDPYI